MKPTLGYPTVINKKSLVKDNNKMSAWGETPQLHTKVELNLPTLKKKNNKANRNYISK